MAKRVVSTDSARRERLFNGKDFNGGAVNEFIAGIEGVKTMPRENSCGRSISTKKTKLEGEIRAEIIIGH